MFKKQILLLMLMMIMAAATVCGKSEAVNSPADALIDFSSCGNEWIGIVMNAPGGAKLVTDSYSIVVQKGESFRVEVHSGDADLAGIKKERQGNEVNRRKNFDVDQADERVYSSDTGLGEEWHFICVVNTGGLYFYCEDVKGDVYSKADIDVMFSAARSLRKK